jgi:hypothetical protein
MGDDKLRRGWIELSRREGAVIGRYLGSMAGKA